MTEKLSRPKVAISLTVFALAIGGMFVWYSGELPTGSFPAVNLTAEQRNLLALVTYVNAKGQEWSIPTGEYAFNVSSNPKLYPRFVSGDIDPLDVKVGDTQRMKVVVVDVAPPERVWAEIEHDAGKDTVALTLVGTKALAREELERRPYLVDESGKLILNDASQGFSVKSIVDRLVSRAEAEGEAEYAYEGSWVVHDTHTKTYRTTFTAESSVGKQEIFVMAWSDPECLFSSGGTLQVSCTVQPGSVEGFDTNTSNPVRTTIPIGTNITVLGNGKFVFNPGSQAGVDVSASGISIDISASGALIQRGYIFYKDEDGDNHTSDVAKFVFQNAGDGNGRYFDGGATESWYTRASRVIDENLSLNQNILTSNLDCLDTGSGAVNVYRNMSLGISGGVDADQDTYTAGVRGGTYCVGASATVNSRTYYAGTGSTPGVASTYPYASAVSTGDCNDADAAVQPDSYQTGQGWYADRSGKFWARTGMGGSLANDFNCSGSVEALFVPYSASYQGSGYPATVPRVQYQSICPDTSSLGQKGTYITISSGLTCGVGNTTGITANYSGSWYSYDPNAGCLKTAGSFVLYGSAMRVCR